MANSENRKSLGKNSARGTESIIPHLKLRPKNEEGSCCDAHGPVHAKNVVGTQRQGHSHDHSHDHSHGHKHGHHHHHHHHHGSDMQGKKLLWVTLLNFIITLVEIIGGILSNSLSLLSDAVHNLGDTMAIFFAYLANRIGARKPNRNLTYGYKRVEILTAFFNAMVLIVICLLLFREAYERFFNPEPIKGLLMLIVAIVGLMANWISVLVLRSDRDKNINMKAAYLHLLGDTLSSVAVIIGGVFIWLYNITWLDPAITVLVGVYIIYHTWGVLKESIDILMQSTPSEVPIDSIVRQIETIKGIQDVHHIHVWRLNDDSLHYESHIRVKDNINMVEMTKIKDKVENILHENDFTHTILQFDYQKCDGKDEMCWTGKG